MATQFDTRALDYHVTLAQTILGLCIDHPQLQNELFCQLIRQTSRHPVQSKMSGMQVVSFDGSTTVTELLQSLQKTLYIRDIKESGFALFTDDPTGQDIEHCLPPQVKVSLNIETITITTTIITTTTTITTTNTTSTITTTSPLLVMLSLPTGIFYSRE
uniref:MyTH4 domain-containing protein n=1 Tax=Octopus bimaculoides TaxID=37653 RepID=A0A0L8GJ61_OCTBM